MEKLCTPKWFKSSWLQSSATAAGNDNFLDDVISPSPVWGGFLWPDFLNIDSFYWGPGALWNQMISFFFFFFFFYQVIALQISQCVQEYCGAMPKLLDIVWPQKWHNWLFWYIFNTKVPCSCDCKTCLFVCFFIFELYCHELHLTY